MTHDEYETTKKAAWPNKPLKFYEQIDEQFSFLAPYINMLNWVISTLERSFRLFDFHDMQICSIFAT